MQKITSSAAALDMQKITSSDRAQSASVLCQKVKWAREQAGWTQHQAAVAMGVSRETFNRWEKGSAVIPPAKLHKLKHLAHVNFSEFKPALVYDSKGYPYPITYEDCRKLWDKHRDDDNDEALDAALEELDTRLCAMEGAEYPERCWQRRLLSTPEGVPPDDDPKTKKAFMASNAAYFARLAAISALC